MSIRWSAIVVALISLALLLGAWNGDPMISSNALRLSAHVLEGADSRGGPTRVTLDLVNTTGQELRVNGRSFLELLGHESYDICRAGVDLRAENTQSDVEYELVLEPGGFLRVEYVLQDLLWTSTLRSPRQAVPFSRAVPSGKYKLRLTLEVSAVNGPAFPFSAFSNKVRLDLR